jgi:PLP dependent protein
LQVHIAKEETKFGLDEKELDEILVAYRERRMSAIHVHGLMGMASFTDNMNIVRTEFRYLKTLYDQYFSVGQKFDRLATLSMGMSGDYKIAIEEGSNMVRIGSLLFGNRN